MAAATPPKGTARHNLGSRIKRSSAHTNPGINAAVEECGQFIQVNMNPQNANAIPPTSADTGNKPQDRINP